MGAKVEAWDDGTTWAFDCPGCNMPHSFSTAPGRWTFNGNTEKPTFNPSLLVRGNVPITDEEHAIILAGGKIKPKPFICHSFVRDGNIEFLNDCTHALAGQTVPLPNIEGAA